MLILKNVPGNRCNVPGTPWARQPDTTRRSEYTLGETSRNHGEEKRDVLRKHAMISLNLRQKIIGCFGILLLCDILVGIVIFKNINLLNNDTALLMHAGELSSIVLQIRRHEKNFILQENAAESTRVLKYVQKAQEATAGSISGPNRRYPSHLKELAAGLADYREAFLKLKEDCTTVRHIDDCEALMTVRVLDGNWSISRKICSRTNSGT